MKLEYLKGKRIASVDFGFKRLGVAVCDELHITITPSKVFDYSSKDFWSSFLDFLEKERVSALVVGFPFRDDNKETEVTLAIKQFVEHFRSISKIPVFLFDETNSTIKAQKIMIEIGKSKKQRRKKENKDLISAAIILKEFIEENNL
ncbi:Holliday junction resolvase RuvX [Bacteroidetes/Chlorobi group bacterium MS-B_bin-24]|nr:MAG: Holliday junction resolvase RuvX [Bacteroidetes/Chlorobi group bacterium MS-B_bin-24]